MSNQTLRLSIVDDTTFVFQVLVPLEQEIVTFIHQVRRAQDRIFDVTKAVAKIYTGLGVLKSNKVMMADLRHYVTVWMRYKLEDVADPEKLKEFPLTHYVWPKDVHLRVVT